jgi:hypothetical protein
MNGHTRESKHRIAVLEEEDVETFVAFCEYAYTGDYSVPRTEPEDEALEDNWSGVVENAPSPGTSWRETYRSESISSVGVPPHAPSPPPEYRTQTDTTMYQDPEPPAMPEPEPEPESVAEPEPEPAPMDPPPEEAADPEPELAHTEVNGFEYADSVVPDAPEQPEYPVVEPEAAEPVEDERPVRRSKKNKKNKKAKMMEKAFMDEEPSAAGEPTNLTPPSTPPPPAPVEDWSAADCEPAPAPEPAEPEPAEPEPAGPEPAVPESNPEPEPESEQTENWDQPSAEPEYTPETSDEPLADSCPGEGNQMPKPRPMLDMSFAQQQASSPCEPGLSMWDEFVSLQYTDDSTSKPSPVTSTSDLPYLTFHAKVYVFATRYLIPALAQLCLRKLHRDLLLISFTDQETVDRSPHPSQKLGTLAARKAQMVLNLVHYVYTKTARLEPISPTSATQLRENELRRLVVHYAACKVKDLAKYHSPDDSATATPSLRPVEVERAETSAPRSLRSLLDMTTELASDLVYRMM